MRSHDEYSTWDGAYVLGALSPADRHEYEEHLATCSACKAQLDELAALPGLLARVPADQALALLPARDTSVADGPKADSLPQLVHVVRRRRTRNRWWTAGSVLVAAAVVAVVAALILPSALSAQHSSEASGKHVTLSQVEASPLSADVRLVTEPWGTRIEANCSYAAWKGSSSDGPWTYTMVVTDRKGTSTQVASWKASAGTTVSPTATTSVPLADIAAIDIRAADGQVLLKTTFT